MVRVLGACLVVLTAVAGFGLGERAALRREALGAEAVLSRAAEELDGLIGRYRYLPAVMARTIDPGADKAHLDAQLQRVADTSGALGLALIRLDGGVIAGTIPDPSLDRPSFDRALDGSLGFHPAVSEALNRRLFFLEHPVLDPAGRVSAVLTLALDVEALESELRGRRDAIYFTDQTGRAFISNRDRLVLHPGFETRPRQSRWGVRLERGLDVPGVPEDAIHVSSPVLPIGMTAHVLTDTARVTREARIWGLTGGLAGGVLALGLALFDLRRRTALARLSERDAAAAKLETEVALRTAELRQEVEERREAEAELRRVQADLVQAGKLTALGEMSAGISHELNQPLTAIQALADTTVDQHRGGQGTRVESNLQRISQLASRAGRIIKTLRAFARKEGEPTTDVDLREVVADALTLAEQRLKDEGVRLHWIRPDWPVMVQGGRVRLQQVLVNLITNAVDAMQDQPGPREIHIGVTQSETDFEMSVRDTGPGLIEADRLFDPFHTTKPVGQGLGLGLSISYGIVQSFGGAISGANAPDGGAIFTMRLPKSSSEPAALGIGA